MTLNISCNSISTILDCLPLIGSNKFALTNKNFYKIYKKKYIEFIKLYIFIQKNFPTPLVSIGLKYKSIYRIKDEKKNPVTTLLMTCIDKHLQSNNIVTLIKSDKWIKRGDSYCIAYKYTSHGDRFELRYFPKNTTFDIVLDSEEQKLKGSFKNIFEAFDSILNDQIFNIVSFLSKLNLKNY